MAEKIHVCLFILSVIFCQGIVGFFSEDHGDSNSFLRQKRVINSEPGGDKPLVRGDAPFIVNIRQMPYNLNIGVGSILSKHTVITAADIVTHLDVRSIQILTGSVYSHRGASHNVIAKHLKFGNHPHSQTDGIALLTIQKNFNFNRYISPIAVHTEPLLAGTPATIFGWGFGDPAPRGTDYRLQLRSITVPIMRHRECVDLYRNRHVISDKDICTYDAHKRCGHTDIGAPLVVDNHLAGIYIWTEHTPGHVNPDVFLIVQHTEYAQWIINNTVYNI